LPPQHGTLQANGSRKILRPDTEILGERVDDASS
jgi:hypothetical protein